MLETQVALVRRLEARAAATRQQHPEDAGATEGGAMRRTGLGRFQHVEERAAGEPEPQAPDGSAALGPPDGGPGLDAGCYRGHVFTGLVEATGILARRERRGPGYRVVVESTLGELTLGESVAINGACLTVVECSSRAASFDVSVETVEKTTLGEVPMGGRVNLERALRVGDRLGGHWVSGHVDGVGVVSTVTPAGDARRVVVQPPPALMAYMADKGSVTLDGVSLTINRALPGAIELMLIPHTLRATNLDGIAPGRRLNVEVDVLARYVAARLAHLGGGEAAGADDTLVAALGRSGYLSE
jgi:riboflavin synthase